MSEEDTGDIIRYERAPGQVAVAMELPEGHVVMISYTQVGDPVFLPEGLPWVGGEMRRVVEIKKAPCPNLGCAGAPVTHYRMSGPDGEAPIWCAECKVHKFQWYQRQGG